jgi:signal transduction histidine kinase
MTMHDILDLTLNDELDVIAARRRTRQVAGLCGFGAREQTRLATTVSELARNAADERHPGILRLALRAEGARRALVITIVDCASVARAAGLPAGAAAHAALAGRFDASGARRFLDDIVLDVGPAGARIVLRKACPADSQRLDAAAIERAVARFEPLQSDVALSGAQRHARALERTSDAISSQNRSLHAQADSLLSADQKKDEFLAILAHELRGPLSAVAMAADMLAKGTAGREQMVGMGHLIARQASHMKRMVEDLLDVSRIVRSEVSIDKHAVDLRDVVADALEQLAPDIARRRHRVATAMPPAAVLVEGDHLRLVQVVGNVVGNAVRYTPEGGAVDIVLARQDRQACLRVSDNGIGIAPDLLPGLFDLFAQARRSSDSRNSGLGLGLALVKALVEAHGGTIAGASAGAGQGSSFEIRLPLAGAPAS